MTALDYYKLKEQPFGVTPDPRYLFLTDAHKDALAALIYRIESGCGFVTLIAAPGTGKTTLLHELAQVFRERARTVFLLQTVSNSSDLLQALLSGLGMRSLQGSLTELQVKLREVLIEQHRRGIRVILVIDEAQNLDIPVLELVRMLSNFETQRDKLIQIVLAGQPQLEEKIGSPDLLQLRQRISFFGRLEPFTPEQTTLYVHHRLGVAGYASDAPLFTKDALTLIALCAEGVPRSINNLCFNALSLGFALQQKPIDRDVMRQVIADLGLGPGRAKTGVVAKPQEIMEVAAPAEVSRPVAAREMPGWVPTFAIVTLIVLLAGGAVFVGVPGFFRGAGTMTRTFAAPSAAPSSNAVTLERNATADLPAAVTSGPAPQAGGSVSTSPDTAEAQNPGVAPALPPTNAEGSVQVAPGQTLLGICADRFGSCAPDLLRRILQLNPSVKDFDHIEPGQKIYLPPVSKEVPDVAASR